MADASFLQTNFQGGEISPFYQGRADDPQYKESLNVCRNALPMEEGGWTRRAGTRFCAPTYQGRPAVLRAFHFNNTNPYALELTDGLARLFAGPDLVVDTYNAVAAISSANPAVITTKTAHGWATGDEVLFYRNSSDSNFTPSLLLGRWFTIGVLSSTTFNLTDSITGQPFDGSTVTLGATRLGVARVFHMVSPYGAAGTPRGYDQTKIVQGPNFAVMLHPNVPPQLVATQVLPGATTPGTFAIQQLQLIDGPYLDPPTDGSTVTPSGTSGSITLTQSISLWAAGTTYNAGDVVSYNGLGYTSLIASNTGHVPSTSSGFWQLNVNSNNATQSGFVQTDIGRSIRFFSEPPAYNAGTAYTTGQLVKWQGAYWSALGSTTGNQPDISPANWQVAPAAAVWSWGVITGYTAFNTVTVSIQGGTLLNTNAMIYRLGLYSDTTGWPTSGAYQEGRLWLGGTTPNRVDGSQTFLPFNFAPTLVDGTVADNCAIAAPFQSETNNAVYWMAAENQGVIIGSKGGEFVVQATNINEALTPASVMVRRTTKFGAENIPPVRCPLALLFVQKHSRKLIEYIADVYTNKYSGTNLAKKTSHLTASGIAEIAFQQEVIPTIWCRMNDGTFKGLLYKRESPFGTQPAEFVGWFRNDLGNGRKVESLQGSPSQDGNTDSVMMVTSDGTTRWVEMLANTFEVGDDIAQGWFLDAGMPAQGAQFTGGGANIQFSGFYYMAGQTFDFVIAGVDMGQQTVAADGTVTVPLTANKDMSTAYLAAVTAKGLTYDAATVVVPISTTPGVPALGSIDMFKQTDAGPLGMNYNVGAFMWDSNTALISNLGGGMAIYSMATGVEQLYRAVADWDAALYTTGFPFLTADTTGLSFPGIVGGNGIAIWPDKGEFFIPASGSNNQFLRFGNIGSLTPVRNGAKVNRKVGTNEGGLPTNGSIPGSGDLIAVTAGSRHYSVTIPVYSLGAGQLNLIDVDTQTDVSPTSNQGGKTLSSLNFGHIDNGVNAYYVRGCAGFQSTNTSWPYAEVCLLGSYQPGSGTQNSITPLHVGKVLIGGNVDTSSSTSVLDAGTVLPTAVQNIPGVNIDAITAPIYDPLDGGVICSVHLSQVPNYNNGATYTAAQQVIGSNGHAYSSVAGGNVGHDPTTDGGVHWTDLGASSAPTANWLLKVNPDTAAIMWQTAMPAGFSFQGDAAFAQTRLTGLGGLYIILATGGTSNAYLVNTATGAMTVAANTDHLLGLFGQAYDDVTGTLAVACNYNLATGTHGPNPINNTPNSFSQKWAVFAPASPGLRSLYAFSATGGTSFVSQGQLLRNVGEESGARNGPALGKTRRLHDYSLLLGQTGQGIQVGTNFTTQINVAALAAYENGPLLANNVLFNGVVWDKVDDDYSYDGMLCWQITRPYPATVLSAEGFLHTQDR